MRYLSVCSGIEAATAAWHSLGWEPVAFSEIDAFPSQVLAHHYPHVPNWGDMTRFQEWPDAAIDVLVGGTPCQSFSVAGLRAGLRDPRGNLMLTYGAIARRYRPKWLVWENVPGVLSSNGGRDFGSFLGLLGELGYGFAYRVLDAQYFGLAQRRKRVFVVGHLGDWRRAAAVLLERASLRGDPAPRREAREDTAGTIAGGAQSRGGFSEDDIPHVVGSLCADTHPGAYTGQDAYTGRLIAHTLRAEGHDASDDGTGRGTPLVPVVAPTLQAGGSSTGGNRPPGTTVDTCDSLIPVHAFDARQSDVIQYGDMTGPLDTDGHTMPVAINLRGREGGAMPELSDLASLRAASGGSSRSFVAAIHENQRGEITTNDTVGALNSGGGKPGQGYPAVAFTASEQANSFAWERDYAPTLNAQVPNDTSNIQTGVRIGMQVRRLTPRECERLQGFPDDYTLVPHRGKPAADGPRYKALGNSMAVPVMHWLGRRIAMVDAI